MEGPVCSICRDEMKEDNISSLVCGHMFHPVCIYSWKIENDACPVCRSPIVFQNNHETVPVLHEVIEYLTKVYGESKRNVTILEDKIYALEVENHDIREEVNMLSQFLQRINLLRVRYEEVAPSP